MSVDGIKLDVTADESVMYWAPAPPKWFVAPAKVKEKLFPKYDGSLFVGDEKHLQEATEASDESEEEEGDEEANFADKLTKERYILCIEIFRRMTVSSSD